MKVRVMQSDIGDCWLTDEHAASSYGQPVIVDDDGQVYGPRDVHGYIHKAGKPRNLLRYENTVPVYDREWEPIEYTPEETRWIEDLYIARVTTYAPNTWAFGASWQSERVKKSMKGPFSSTMRWTPRWRR